MHVQPRSILHALALTFAASLLLCTSAFAAGVSVSVSAPAITAPPPAAAATDLGDFF